MRRQHVTAASSSSAHQPPGRPYVLLRRNGVPPMASASLGALATFAAAVCERLGMVRIRAQSLKLRAEAVQEMWVRRAESKVSTAAPGSPLSLALVPFSYGSQGVEPGGRASRAARHTAGTRPVASACTTRTHATAGRVLLKQRGYRQTPGFSKHSDVVQV